MKLSTDKKTSKGSICHHEEKRCISIHDGGAMTSVSQVSETLRQILEEEANTFAKETGFIQRVRAFSGSDAGANADLGVAGSTSDQLRWLDAGGWTA
jgi:hypothetical protein